MEIHLLGPLEVIAGGRAVEIGSGQQRVLLAMLALNRGVVVSSDALTEALWLDSPPPSAPATLRTLVARLRRTLAEVGDAPVRGKDSGYVLTIEADGVDANRFERLVEAARQSLVHGRADEAAEALRAGLDLWRGPALGELAELEFAHLHVRRLEEARLGAVEDLAEAELALGRPADAVARLESLVGSQPLRERAWGQLMLALYRLGRQADALRAYQEVRRVLGEELGIEPNPTLRDLEVRILRQDPELEPRPGPAVRTSGLQGSRGHRVFLFTDIEASTRRWEGDQEAMGTDLARHDAPGGGVRGSGRSHLQPHGRRPLRRLPQCQRRSGRRRGRPERPSLGEVGPAGTARRPHGVARGRG